MALIAILNPNSSVEVTERIAWAAREALSGVKPGAEPRVLTETLRQGPPGIVSQEHIDQVTPLVADFVAAHDRDTDAFIIACFSDPGVAEARSRTAKPVIGIGEAGVAEAIERGDRVGVVAVSSVGRERHFNYYRRLGVADHICGERAIDLSPKDSGDEALAFGRIVEAALALRDEDGARAIVLGCAGMAQLRPRIEAEVGIPVIDPCAAAVRAAVVCLSGLEKTPAAP